MDNFIKKIWTPKIWLPLAIMLFVIQLLVPAYMIFEQQQTLKHGNLYKFKIRPIDPYDPFRGRYVVLSFDAENSPIPLQQQNKNAKQDLKRNAWVYAKLTQDEDGYARFSELSLTKPTSDNDYLRVQLRYGGVKDNYPINIPFDRYYAPENKAYAIEANVRQRTRRNSDDQVYVTVKIRNGKGTIEDLFINDTPILDFVEGQIQN
ncbi:MAG: GDYXXLXY domain-containing protein [Gammaproteobacteria bacterium]|nr:GDYXXLXY domain-containing protein [Gammaproteobacteria bacterium]